MGQLSESMTGKYYNEKQVLQSVTGMTKCQKKAISKYDKYCEAWRSDM